MTTFPPTFEYANTFLAGYPVRDLDFLRNHPRMDRGHRAKIFSPFAALDGFEDTLETKNILYAPEVFLSEEEQSELNRRLTILAELTKNGRAARRNRITVTVTYFVPCQDQYNDAYLQGEGKYQTVTGIVWEVGQGSLLVGEKRLLFGDVRAIEGPVFEHADRTMESLGYA